MGMFLGCGSTVSQTVVPDFDVAGIRLVAVMPVSNKTNDAQAAAVLRAALVEELHFKGYPKIPAAVIDEKLSGIYGTAVAASDKTIPPTVVGEAVGVDTVLYCTLNEWKTSYLFFYAPTTVSASFELRDGTTGETIWCADSRVVKRNYDFTEKGLEMKSCQSCELAVQEIVDKAISTFPNGPEYLGSSARKKRFLGLW